MAARARALVGIVAVLLAGLWWVGTAAPAHACSCIADPPSEAERMATSEIVVVGRATTDEVRPAVDPGGQAVGSGERVYTFDLEYVHKGTVPDPAVVVTATDGAACGFALQVGELYKLFPSREEGSAELHVNLCGGNRLATAADLQPWDAPTTTAVAPSTTGPPGPIATIPLQTIPRPALQRPTTSTTEDEAPTVATDAPSTSTPPPSTTIDDRTELAQVVVVDDQRPSGDGTSLVAVGVGVASFAAVSAAGVLAYRRAAADEP